MGAKMDLESEIIFLYKKQMMQAVMQ